MENFNPILIEKSATEKIVKELILQLYVFQKFKKKFKKIKREFVRIIIINKKFQKVNIGCIHSILTGE